MTARALPEVQTASWRGAPVLAATKRVFPLVGVRLLFRGGALLDPPGKEGLSILTARMLERGTKRRSHVQVLDAIESIGASLSSHADGETIRFDAAVLTRSLDRFLEVLAEMLLEPAFSEEEVEKAKEEMLAELAIAREDDRGVADQFFHAKLLGSAHGRFHEGTEASLPALTRADVEARWRETVCSSRLIASAAGDLDADELTKKLEKHLGRLPAGAPAARTKAEARPLSRGVEVLLVDKPERTQTQIFLGRTVPGPLSPEYLPFVAANHSFGGMFTARLMQEVRVKRGWSYGAYSRLHPFADLSTVAAWTFPANADTVPAIRLLLDLLASFATSGVSREELEAGKGHLKNTLGFDLETPDAQVARRVYELILGLPDDWTPRYLDAVESMTADRANAAARGWLEGQSLALTLLCTAEPLVAGIAQLPEVTRIDVVPFDAGGLETAKTVFDRAN